MGDPLLDHLTTEARNPASEQLDTLSSVQIVRLMNEQDRRLADAVERAAPQIAHAIDMIADRLGSGGRLIYVGAGTSGRLGVLDASECPPTFSVKPEQVVGIMAGGETALTRSVEGAEDHAGAGIADLENVRVNAKDVVVGVTASGRTPYVLGALEYAKAQGAYTLGLSCNEAAPLHDVANATISVVVGPEVLAGSTRLKAGTAQKMVLNMLTTGAFVRLGKTFGNLMVDVQASNEKLRARAIRIVAEATGSTREEAAALLERCDGETKTAIVAHHRQVDAAAARALLAQSQGRVRAALETP